MCFLGHCCSGCQACHGLLYDVNGYIRGLVRRIPSKFDLRRFCRAAGASALVSLGAPRADELGFAGLLEVREVGGANVTVLSQVSFHRMHVAGRSRRLSSVELLRGSRKSWRDWQYTTTVASGSRCPTTAQCQEFCDGM